MDSFFPSFLPSEECLTPLPSLPHLWGGSPRTGVRPRPPGRAERIYPTQSCPPGCQLARDHRRAVCPNFLPLVLPSTGWVCVRGWCVSECTRPCTRVCVCIVRQSGKWQVLIFLFHDTVLLRTCFQLLPNKNGKTKPTRLLIYHSAKSSMLHKQARSQMCHDHIL